MEYQYLIKAVDHAPFIIIILGLMIAWHGYYARWLLISYGILETLDHLIHLEIRSWLTHFYIMNSLIIIVFMFPILLRRPIALFIFRKTGREYFAIVGNRQGLSKYEVIILWLMASTAVVNFITWIEVICYKYWIIDYVYIKFHFRDYYMVSVHLVTLAAMYSYSFYTFISKSQIKKVHR
ncbi:hypothetical protein JF50_22890 [Pseudoalteromonas luteoviolacea]|uniref:Uncharacterized protein n=1 Tax=Pseudoalteromonas luteoviolacea TaxID=43657 RepID=A0A0C1Q5F6_9GAMM|nr:hypothetical protein [Pseudoalteromonas luteoviolacea]KID54740.1 hypothetical protein JF50_22890 [Pseudoalteromonas luteoviolacea]